MPNTYWFECILYERRKRGWSQEYAAERLHVDARILRDWEIGKHVPIYKYRKRLSWLYKRSIEELGLVYPQLKKDVL